MKKYYKDSAIQISGKAAYKSHDRFEDGSSNWIILDADGSKFATAHHDAPCQLWQVFRNGGQTVGAGRTLNAAIADIHDL